MANQAGVLNPYVEIGSKEDLLAQLFVLGWDENPLFRLLPKRKVIQKEVDWNERGYLETVIDLKGATASAVIFSSSTTTTILISSNVTALKIGDMLVFENPLTGSVGAEVVQVLTNDLVSIITVTRKIGGTATAIKATWQAIRLGSGIKSGQDALSALATKRARKVNYTHTFEQTVFVAGDAASDVVVGGSLLAQEIAFGLKELGNDIERTLIRGIGNAGSASKARTMKGITDFISSEITSVTSNHITNARWDTFLQGIWDNGGRPNVAICGPTAMRGVASMIGANRADPRGVISGSWGVKKPDQIVSPFGSLTFVLNPQMVGTILSQSILALDTRRIKIGIKRRPSSTVLAKDGDADKRMLLAELTLIMANEGAHGWLKGVKTGA